MPERVMVFVDGSNFLIELSKELNIQFRADRPPPSASRYVQQMIKRIGIRYNIIRSFWFASYQGSDEYRDKIRSYLREYEFEPVLFKKKDGKEKGVDIALTKEMLVNAFNQNFDIGYLIAGDGDYVGLVNEVKRTAQLFEVSSFSMDYQMIYALHLTLSSILMTIFGVHSIVRGICK